MIKTLLKLSIRPAMIILPLVLPGTASLAQTQEDLQRKYSSASNHFVSRVSFVVRPGILLTPSYTADNQICDAIIEPELATEKEIFQNISMPVSVVDAIIDEIAPLDQRGKMANDIMFGNKLNAVIYERMTISKNGVFDDNASVKISESAFDGETDSVNENLNYVPLRRVGLFAAPALDK